MKKLLVLALLLAGLVVFAIKCDGEAGDSGLFLYNYACCFGSCNCTWGEWHKEKQYIKSTEEKIVTDSCAQCAKERPIGELALNCCVSYYKIGEKESKLDACGCKRSNNTPKSIDDVD